MTTYDRLPCTWWGALALLRLFGPGRVLIQSGSHGHVHKPRLGSLNRGNMVIQQW